MNISELKKIDPTKWVNPKKTHTNLLSQDGTYLSGRPFLDLEGKELLKHILGNKANAVSKKFIDAVQAIVLEYWPKDNMCLGAHTDTEYVKDKLKEIFELSDVQAKKICDIDTKGTDVAIQNLSNITIFNRANFPTDAVLDLKTLMAKDINTLISTHYITTVVPEEPKKHKLIRIYDFTRDHVLGTTLTIFGIIGGGIVIYEFAISMGWII